jgi:hypothetical protein
LFPLLSLRYFILKPKCKRDLCCSGILLTFTLLSRAKQSKHISTLKDWTNSLSRNVGTELSLSTEQNSRKRHIYQFSLCVKWQNISGDRTCHVTEQFTWQNISRDRTYHVIEHVAWQNISRNRTYHVTEHAMWQNMSPDRSCHVTEHITRQNISRDRTCHLTKNVNSTSFIQQSFYFAFVRL